MRCVSAGVGLRRGCGSAGSSTVSSSTSGPGARGGATGRSSSGTPSARSTVTRRVSTPVSRPLLSLGGLLGSNSFHTEYREQMSPSWWLGAAACSSSWLQLSPPPEVMELVEKKKLTEQFKTVEGLIDRAVRPHAPSEDAPISLFDCLYFCVILCPRLRNSRLRSPPTWKTVLRWA